MSEDAIYTSSNVSITKLSVDILDRTFATSDIAEVSAFDERPRAVTWLIVTGGVAIFIKLLGWLLPLAVPAGGGTSSRIWFPLFMGMGLPVAIAFFGLVFSAARLLILLFNPRAGVGLVINTHSGKAEIIRGLDRTEIEQVCNAIRMATAEEDSAVRADSDEDRGRVVVEEGVYRKRKWQRYNTGEVEAESLTGAMKQFASFEEFKAYVE